MKEYKMEIETNKIKCWNKWEQLSKQDLIIDEQIFAQDEQIRKRNIVKNMKNNKHEKD
jgi:hypothetical protein